MAGRLGSSMGQGSHVDFLGYDIEKYTTGIWTRVSNLGEANPGYTSGLITYVAVNEGVGLTSLPNIFSSGGDGFISVYNGGMRQANSAVSLTGQTTSISATNLSGHPVANALYRVEYYLNCTAAGSAGTVTVTITWNDGTSETITLSSLTLSAQGSVSGDLLVKPTSGAIQYSTTVTGAMGSPQYSLDIRVLPLG